MKYLILLLAISYTIFAHKPHHLHEERKINFPDLPGYITLKCDLHMHTVFSDGSVWPNIRVEEAIRDGLDAIAMTDHIEYQPYKDDIPHPDRNRSFQLAKKAANNNELIVINGSEITRSMPPGHSNAIFLKDANKLLVDDPIDAYREAKKQGAFTFWNHPQWPAQFKDGIAKPDTMHKLLISEGLLSGIEVVNDVSYSDEALQIALDNNLTLIGNSDIHLLIDWQYNVPGGGHRPVTLVFAKEKSEAGIKEALESRRTVVWHNNTLIGREEQMMPLLNSCLKIESAEFIGDTQIASVKIINNSDAEFIFRNTGHYTFHKNPNIVMIAPHDTTEIQVKTITRQKQFDLKFEVMNCVTAPGKHPELTLGVKPE